MSLQAASNFLKYYRGLRGDSMRRGRAWLKRSDTSDSFETINQSYIMMTIFVVRCYLSMHQTMKILI